MADTLLLIIGVLIWIWENFNLGDFFMTFKEIIIGLLAMFGWAGHVEGWMPSPPIPLGSPIN
ncbi:hypothetical protein [Methanogenium organophilum]|uniref:Uncharacterized protein n=1 Tax=Methanogenium organophilum TaxID=2199 RepID=A0A9X9S5X5_METOG|nr:hypothetical protein [Methanogenium organophilum]WAI02312.1 hypothetical protein OU421_05420 [Methanogenium organophilum]